MPDCPACGEPGVRKDTSGRYYRCPNHDDCRVTEFHDIP